MEQPSDWTPIWIIVAAGAIAGMLRWVAKRLLMISPTRAALEQLSADQRQFHDTMMADMKTLHDGIGTVAGHQEAQDTRLRYLENAVLKRDGR